MTVGVEGMDRAIAVINMEECYRRRVVRGQDLNDWHEQLDRWIAAGDLSSARALLYEIIGATETLVQYDQREPQPYWHEKLAKLHRRDGDRWAESAVLCRWLAAWPADRQRFDSARQRIRKLLDESYQQAGVMVTARIGFELH